MVTEVRMVDVCVEPVWMAVCQFPDVQVVVVSAQS